MGVKRYLRRLFQTNRQSPRVDGGESVIHIDGTPHRVIDWSEIGLRIAGYDGAPPVGERFAFRFELPLTAEDVFEFEA